MIREFDAREQFASDYIIQQAGTKLPFLDMVGVCFGGGGL